MPVARNNKPRRRRRSGGIGGWIGIGLLMATGLAVAGVVYLKNHRLDPPLAAAALAKLPKKHVHPPDPLEAPVDVGDDAPSRYAFYDQLPKLAVAVPGKDKDKEARSEPVQAPAETRPGTYVLQVGSYSNFADADKVRAKLALHGVESSIQRVTGEKNALNRIRVGPIADLAKLNRMRATLRKLGVDYMQVRVGD